MNVIFTLIHVLFLAHYIILDVTAEIELSYEDLMAINAACRPRDTCTEARIGDRNIADYSCSCSSRCSKLGNCCIDSEDKNTFFPKLKPSCKLVAGHKHTEGYFMVDKCAPDDKTRWKKLCEEDWKGENSIIPLVPVTSLFSSMTYKNYFCLRCHETTDEFRFWYVALMGNSETLKRRNQSGATSYTLLYDRDLNTWLVTEAFANGSFPLPVNLGFEIPKYIASLADKCDSKVISICSNSWRDDVTREKCAEYMAVVYIDKNGMKLTYKNPHCALCNFESLEDMECAPSKADALDAGRKTYPLSSLISINLHPGDKAEKESECRKNFLFDPSLKICSDRAVLGVVVLSKMDDDPLFLSRPLNIIIPDVVKRPTRPTIVGRPKCERNYIYDPYRRKCVRLICAIPGYVIKNGRCSRP